MPLRLIQPPPQSALLLPHLILSFSPRIIARTVLLLPSAWCPCAGAGRGGSGRQAQPPALSGAIAYALRADPGGCWVLDGSACLRFGLCSLAHAPRFLVSALAPASF